MKITDKKELEKIANTIRREIIEEIYNGQSGHPGGSLSAVELLTVLYFNQMNVDIKNPRWSERDRFILSKGHASALLYSVLAEKGFFSKEELKHFRKIDSILQGHPDMNKVPGVDMTTGSLGQGLSAANGIAIAGRLNRTSYRVYCMLGDGEIEEGQVWEALRNASKYGLDNLCIIIDNNNLQIDGTIEEVAGLTNISDKIRSFGIEVLEIDGHNIDEIIEAFEKAKTIKQRPTAIVAKTIKGKGISFMENMAAWHGKALTKEEYDVARKELEEVQR